MVNFPQSFDDDDSLFLAVNNLRTQLTAGITDSDTTATVVTTSGFPPTGYISILTGPDILDMEAITYSGTTDFTFLNLGRGADGTEAFLHNIGDNVDQTIVAQHHNELKDAIIILEEFVGVSGSENFVPKDQYGNVLISGALTLTTGTITAGGGIFSDTLTVSGVPVLTTLSEDFVPKDQYGNVIISGTTSTYGLSVEGCVPADFKSDVTVSGGVVVGRILPSSPVTTTSISEDEPFTLTADTGYEDVTGIDPLTVTTGTNLLLFRASGASTIPNAFNYRILYDGTDEVAEVIDGATSADDPSKHWQGVELAGFKVIDSDGSQEAVVQISRAGASFPVTMGAAAMTSIPLTELGLVENVDYWFTNGSDTPISPGTPDTDLVTFSPTLPETGDYLVFGYAEGHDGDISGNGAIRYQLDGSDISPKYFIYTNGYVACPFVKLINIAAGARTFKAVVNGGSTFSPSDYSYFLRGRFCIIKASSFNQVVQTRKSSTTTTSSTEFTQVPGTALTYTPPNVNETLLVLANPEFSNDVTDVNVTYQLVQSGTCQEKVYNVDAGGYVGGSPDNKPTLLFTVVEDAPLPTTWVLEHRSPEGGNANTDDVSVIALGFTSPNPDTNYTTITNREVTSVQGTFETVNANSSLTISGVPVSTGTVATFDPEDFVPKDEFGNVIISGTLVVADDVTISGGVELGATLVTGTLVVCSGVDFKDDLTVSGCISVGHVPASTTPQALYSFEDAIYTTDTSASYEETGVSLTPAAGVNLVLFRANAGAGPAGSTGSKIKASYAGGDIAESTGNASSSASAGHWNNTEMSGFKIIDTTGADSVKIHAAATSSPRSAEVGAQQIISVPLEDLGLVEGTDYWFDNGSDSFVAIPSASGTQVVKVTEIELTAPVTGPYLLLGHCEAKISNYPANVSYRVYYYVNESNISNHVAREGDVSGTTSHTMPWAQVVNLTAGTNKVSVRVGRWNTTNAFSYKRARIALINGDAFNSLTGTRSFVDYQPATSTFIEMGALAQTHTPTSDTQVLVIGSTVTHSTDVTDPRAIPTIKISDDTDLVDYAEDWGEGHARTNSNLPWTGFAVKDNVTSPTDWKMFTREANSTGNTCTVNHSAMVVWDLSAPQPEQTLLTTICKDKILTPELCADNISVINSGTLTVDVGGDIISPVVTVSESLTISGVPVATGTSGGGGGGTITDINTTVTGPSVTITGVLPNIHTITEGNVITISGTDSGGAAAVYVHTQGAASTTWNITHGLGTEVVNYITLDNSNEQVYPDTFTVDDSNNVTIDWVAAQDGVAYIFGDTAATQIGDLQFAYDSGDGSIVTVSGKPVLISGTEDDGDVDFKVIGSGTFTEALTVGEGTTYLDSISITTASGIFSDSATVSGAPVLTSDSVVGAGSALTVKESDGSPSVANVDTIVVTDGTLTDDGGGQVTISTGGTGGGGSAGAGEIVLSGTLKEWNVGATPDPSLFTGTEVDDEFSGTLDAKWTFVDAQLPGNITIVNSNGSLSLKNPNSTDSDAWIWQNIPNGTDSFTFYYSVEYMTDNNDYQYTGLLLGSGIDSGTTNDYIAIGCGKANSWGNNVSTISFAQKYTNNGYIGGYGGGLHYGGNQRVYFKVAVNQAAQTFSYQTSLDGIYWDPVPTVLDRDYTDHIDGIEQIALGMFGNGASAPQASRIEHFRTVSGTHDLSLPYPGNFVTISGVPASGIGLEVTGGGSTLVVEEQDGSPTVTGVTTIKVTNATLTDEGGGVVSIDTGGSGGGGGELTFSGAPRFLDPIRIWDARVPPNPPNTVSGTLYDDEFVGDVGDEIDTGRWSIFDPNSALVVDPPQLYIGDSVKLFPDGMPSFNSSVIGIYQDAPEGGLNTSITLCTYLNLNAYTSNTGATNSTDAYAGIIFLEDSAAPTTSNILLMGVHLTAREDTPSFAVGVWEFTEHSDLTPTPHPSTAYQDQFTNFGEAGIYLKATYIGGSTHRFDMSWSRDGRSWRIIATPDLEINLAMSTFNAFGLGGQFVNGYVYGADFSFFRALDSGVTWAEVPAGYMHIERDPTASGLNVSGTISGTGGGGTTDHSALDNLDYASAGHTGFASEAELLTVSGHLQDEIDAGTGGGSGGELTTSGMWFNVHAIPEVPSPYSDWFDDNSTNPALSGTHPLNWDKWTQWDVDAVSGTATGHTMPAYEGTGSVYRDTNWMRINHDASTTGGWTGVYQATPDGHFTITTKVGIHGTYETNADVRMGIFVADDLDGAPSTSDLYSCSLYHVLGVSVADTTGGGLYSQIEGALWTDYNSISTEATTAAAPHPGTSAWLRLNYNASTQRVEAVVSEDGINWKRLTYTDLGFAPSHMGFGIQKGTAGAMNAAFEFFAVSDTQNSRAGATGYGRLVPIVISGSAGGGGGTSVGQYTQAFTDQTVISVTHNAGSLVHFTTVLDESSFVVEAQIQYGENTDEVTLSEIMSGSVVVLG